jgi:hypothetical protein
MGDAMRHLSSAIALLGVLAPFSAADAEPKWLRCTWDWSLNAPIPKIFMFDEQQQTLRCKFPNSVRRCPILADTVVKDFAHPSEQY